MNRVCVKKAAQFQTAATGPKNYAFSHLHIIHGLQNYGPCTMDNVMFYKFNKDREHVKEYKHQL